MVLVEAGEVLVEGVSVVVVDLVIVVESRASCVISQVILSKIASSVLTGILILLAALVTPQMLVFHQLMKPFMPLLRLL